MLLMCAIPSRLSAAGIFIEHLSICIISSLPIGEAAIYVALRNLEGETNKQ
ncbi:MAG: hypothetical protein H6Q69_239 [Firmicutes bacterium]|nr:hypothetical protein [Bacillota bacterium]